jgi:2-(1,2-epoxy-1,2-dihydrophenyl)acetyl-CoA isomerase
MDFFNIIFEKFEDYVIIKFNRPDLLNSFNRQMSLELQYALDLCQADSSVRAVLITGEGRGFCAGQDLSEAISDDFDVAQTVKEHYNLIIKKIRSIEKPIIAAVNGVAAGAGANISLACDIVIASEKASFIQSFSKIGLIPDSGGTYFLPRIIGMAKSSAIMMLGDKISAIEAERIGMIYKYFPHDALMNFALEIVQTMAKMPTYGIGLTKRALNNSFSNCLDLQLELEMYLQSSAAESYDYKEGVNAFLEKRTPKFIGKQFNKE